MILKRTKKLIIFLTLIAANVPVYASNFDNLKKYLTSLESVTMDFKQTDSIGNIAEGKLIIQKPYNFRCNYYEPYPLLIIGNKTELAMYDYELEQTSRIKRKDNMFNFLLEEADDLDKHFNLENIIDNNGSFLYKFNHRESGRNVSLVMLGKPLTLQQILIDEPDGNIIDLDISNIKHEVIKGKNLFSIPDTKIFGPPKRYGKGELIE